MKLQAYQSCRSNEGWQAIRVPSDSSPDLHYTVHVSPWQANESICDCPGYLFHKGKCKHQQRAWDLVCRWTEKDGWPEDRTTLSDMECPRCGQHTKWEVEVVPDDGG